MEDEFFRLMANPSRTKKKNIINDELFIILKKKYPNYDWDNKLYKFIKDKIELNLIDYTINNIINNMMNDIINKICKKNN